MRQFTRQQTPPKQYDHLLHPYIFMLQEGKKIQHDFLDYSLLMLEAGQPTILPSPGKIMKSNTLPLHVLKK